MEVDLWRELPFSGVFPSAESPCREPSNLQLDKYTYPYYRELTCDFIIQPNAIFLLELESHGNYRGYGKGTFKVMIPQPQETMPVYYPSPNVSRPASQLTEEEQVKIAQRIGLIQHLPTGTYDGCKKNRECVICMIEFIIGDAIRYLPCMHTYHVECIDDWLMRSFTCPSCMEPVDAALLTTYETN